MVFFTQLFTSKRGPLARIWLAAHWEKKITKTHVFECNLEATVNDIISPQIQIGLRTSSHLLLGVVRIYFRKAKYLLADCSDAVVRIKVVFRPGQLDLPQEGMEAMVKAITLPEDFTDFESQLPDLNAIDVVDHFSLNQSRTEEITMKENFGSSFLTMEVLGDDVHCRQGLFDTSFQSLGAHGDAFGDEGMAFDVIDFIANANENALLSDCYGESPEVPATPPPTAVSPTGPSIVSSDAMPETLTLNDPTLLENAKEGFALEPVAVTTSTKRKKGSIKRKLVVDQSKALSNEAIKAQLADYSDLLISLDIAPPTRQLMEWKENGGVDYLFSHFCTPVMNSDLQKLFDRHVLTGKMRTNSKAGDDNYPEESTFIEPSFIHSETPDSNAKSRKASPQVHKKRKLGVLHPEPHSEESMLVHPSGMKSETPLMQTQHSALESQNMDEKSITGEVQHLLQSIKKQNSSPDATFSIHEMCKNCSRSRAAVIFFCLLVLKKKQAIDLHQNAPFSDIIITRGPCFLKF